MADVLQILLSPRIGGAETLVAMLEREWTAAGISNVTIYLDEESFREGSRWGRLQTLRRAIAKHHPRAVLSHSAIPNVYARLAAPRGVPIITVLHTATDDYASVPLRIAESVLRARTSAVVAVSDRQAQIYRSHFNDRVPVHVIQTGLSPTITQKKAISAVPTLVVTVARIAQQKNPSFWIDVVSRAQQELPGLKFQWWGPAAHEDGIESTVAKSAELSNAEFCGPVSDPADILKSADILLHTSSREAPGIALIEAAGSGTPVLCSDQVSGTLPLIVPRIEFADLDLDSCLASLRRVVQSWDVVAKDARAAAPKVLKAFSSRTSASAYLAVMGL